MSCVLATVKLFPKKYVTFKFGTVPEEDLNGNSEKINFSSKLPQNSINSKIVSSQYY